LDLLVVAAQWPVPSLTRMQIPQLLANYKAKNADGLSMTFLVVWLMGDVSNLVGMFIR